MKNRKLLLIISVVLALTMSLGGTLAYLTDTDSNVNVMTVGNVDIEQLEYQRAEDVKYNAGDAGAGNGVKEGGLVPFEDNKPLYPAYPVQGATNPYTAEPSPNLFYWGEYVGTKEERANGGNGAGNGLWNDDKLVGAIDKFVFVENKGTSDAYYRTIFAFECPEGVEYSQGADKQLMMNTNGHTLFDWENIGYITVDEVRYLLVVATYQAKLAAGEISRPSLLQVVMTHNATNDDVAKMGDTYEILALTQAMQTVNFESMAAGDALDIAFGSVADNAAVWFKGVVDNHTYEEEIAPDMEVLTIDNLDEFKQFAAAVNSNGTFKDVNVANNGNVYVKLNTDLDLSTYTDFVGIGNGNNNRFDGVFNGYGHTVKNWTVTANWNYYMAFIRTTYGGDVKHVTFENFNLGGDTSKGTNCGVVIGCVGSGDVVIDDVTVKNSVVNNKTTIGAVVGGMTEGHLTITNCSVDNVKLSNVDGRGGVLLGNGYSYHDYEASGFVESNNTISNVTWTKNGEAQDSVPKYNYEK